MKTFSFLLMGMMIFMLLNCSDDNTGTNSDDGNVLIPLKIGNQWIGIQRYYAPDGETVIDQNSFTYHIFDDVNTATETWYSLEFIINDTVFDPRLVYINRDDGLWEQSPCGNLVCRVELWGEYPSFEGDSFWVNHIDYHEIMIDLDSVNIDDLETMYDFASVKSTDTTITVPAGTYSCYHYKWKPNFATNGNTLHFYIAPNFGFVKKEEYDINTGTLVESWELENMVAN